jgi:hypothetical protein
MTPRFRGKIGRGIQATTGTPTQLARKANLLSGAQTGPTVVAKRNVLFAVCFVPICINFTAPVDGVHEGGEVSPFHRPQWPLVRVVVYLYSITDVGTRRG